MLARTSLFTHFRIAHAIQQKRNVGTLSVAGDQTVPVMPCLKSNLQISMGVSPRFVVVVVAFSRAELVPRKRRAGRAGAMLTKKSNLSGGVT
jgi:hypothetical protein